MDTLDDLVSVVNASSSINKAVLVGNEAGEVFIETFNWAAFLGDHFRKFPQLLQYHHFSVSACEPGKVMARMYSSSAEETFELLKKPLPCGSFPDVVVPPGLSKERKQYLFSNIRQFVLGGEEGGARRTNKIFFF